jgi:hypothetical protein
VVRQVNALDSLPDDIAEYLDALQAFAETATDEAEARVEQMPRPRIDHAKALRLMRWLHRQRKRHAEELAAYDAEIERLTEARSRLAARGDRSCEGAEALLAAYLRDLMALDPKRKSVDLAPYGRVQSHRTPAQPSVADEALLMKWAEGAGYIEMRPHLRWAELKKALTVAEDGRVLLDGEPVPGVECVPERLDITVKPAEEAI